MDSLARIFRNQPWFRLSLSLSKLSLSHPHQPVFITTAFVSPLNPNPLRISARIMDSKRPSFRDEVDDGLVSLAAGISQPHRRQPPSLVSRPLYYSTGAQRRATLRSSSVGSARSGRFFDNGFDEQPESHFLDSCFFCKAPLAKNKDIFMYRGDTPFCSEECRQEQIDMDEAKERKSGLSAASMKAMRKNQKRSKSTSPSKAQDCTFRTSTVAAA